MALKPAGQLAQWGGKSSGGVGGGGQTALQRRQKSLFSVNKSGLKINSLSKNLSHFNGWDLVHCLGEEELLWCVCVEAGERLEDA